MSPEKFTLLISLLLTAGCMAEKDADAPAPNDPNQPQEPTDPTNPTDPAQGLVPSSRARVRFLGGQRYASRLAAALELSPDVVCRELGQYDCVDVVHNITLGGVEAYRLGILEPLDGTAATTPVAVERIALSACETRAERDFDAPEEAEVFAGLTVEDGRLADPTAPEVRTMIDTLYRRLLQRSAQDAEIDHLTDLYTEMAAVGDPELARRWASVSCFAVATTVEALFY